MQIAADAFLFPLDRAEDFVFQPLAFGAQLQVANAEGEVIGQVHQQ